MPLELPPEILNLLGVLVTIGVPALVSLIVSRRSSKVEQRRVENEGDDKLVNGFNSLLERSEAFMERADKRSENLESKVSRLEGQVRELTSMFDTAIRFIRRLLTYIDGGSNGPAPGVPHELAHLFDNRPTTGDIRVSPTEETT